MAEPVKIWLCGDVMTGRGVDQALPHPSDPELREPALKSAVDYVALAEARNGPFPRPVGFDYPWGEALEARRRAAPDVTIVNLETAVTRSGDFAPKGINYRMNPRNVACLTAGGVDACSLANNHVLDFGREGLAETLRTLADAGIHTVGAGADLAAASAPAILPTPAGPRVLLIGCAAADSGVPPDWAAREGRPGVNLIEPGEAAARQVAEAFDAIRRPGDVCVVSVHFGPNWGYRVEPGHRAFAHALHRAGVAVVHGHSSHHAKGMEVFEGRLALYGCGDFLNDYEGIGGYETYRPELANAWLARVDPEAGRLAALEILPFRMRHFRLERPEARDMAWMRERLDREAGRFGAHVVQAAEDRLELVWQRSATGG